MGGSTRPAQCIDSHFACVQMGETFVGVSGMRQLQMPSQIYVSNDTDSLCVLKTTPLVMTNVTLVTNSLCSTMSKSIVMYWHIVQETSLNVCCTYVQ